MAPTESMRQQERERIRDAAPKLLAACEAVLGETDRTIGENVLVQNLIIEKVAAAVRKAKGIS